jgi:ABC-type branched-subunit amino acid transport system substrate-binding protein
MNRFGIAATFLIVVAAMASAADLLSPGEKRGREIYLHGKGATAPMTAFFGSDAAGEINASVVPCASCHGADGRGAREGTVAPSDIRWSVLSKPFVGVDGARHRPRYDDALLGRSVRDAVDAGGTPLFAVMPRYRIAERDLTDLLAYMRRLGNEPQPGLDDDTIVVATVVPLSGPRAAAGDAARTVIGGYFDDVNKQGGLFGRRLKLEAIDAAAPPQKIAAALGGPIFGVVGASWSPDDQTLDDLVGAERIPLVTPFATAVESRSSVSSFFIFPDLESQALALIDFAAERAGKRAMSIALVHDRSNVAHAAADAAGRHCTPLGWSVTEKPSEDADLLLVIGNVDAAAIAAATKSPQILIAGASISRSLFELRGKTVFVAAPTLPDDISAEGKGEIESFATRHHLSQDHRAAEIAAYAAVKIFVEALRLGGRDITREKVIASLEHLYGFATGVTPPITYGPSRHVGTIGAYIVEVDFDRRTFGPASRWITPQQ